MKNANFDDIDESEVRIEEKSMDIVVILALVVLGVVFFLSLVLLLIMCQRRRVNQKKPKSQLLVPFETPPVRFVRPDNAEDIETMEQLAEVIGELLDNNRWLFEARGIMQHVVAVLTICRTVTQKLTDVQLPTSPSPFHDAIGLAIRNIYPRFDDLIESIAAQPVDMRLLEARALSLGTVCWSLYLPYTLLDSNLKEVLSKPLNQMNLHLVTIRTAAHLVAMAEKGAENNINLVDLKDHLLKMRSQIRGDLVLEVPYHSDADGEDDDADHESDDEVIQKTSTSSDDHEKMPLVQSEAIVDMIELTRVPLIDQEKLMLNGDVANGNHHHHHHHHHNSHHRLQNGSLNTVEEINEEDHHGEGTSTSCSSSSTSSSSSSTSSHSHPIDPKA